MGGGGGGNEPRQISSTARAGQEALTQGAIPLIQQGFGNLAKILGRQGRTTPQFFERQLRGIERGTEASLQAAGQRSAQQGFRGPGQDAILQAIRSAGGQQQGDLRAQEAALAEQRQRQDLGLLGQLGINPLVQMLGAEFGAPLAAREPGGLEIGASALGSTLGGVGGILTGLNT